MTSNGIREVIIALSGALIQTDRYISGKAEF